MPGQSPWSWEAAGAGPYAGAELELLGAELGLLGVVLVELAAYATAPPASAPPTARTAITPGRRRGIAVLLSSLTCPSERPASENAVRKS